MTQPLSVDPKVLRDAVKVFGQTADGALALGLDAPLRTAAAGIPQLATAAACLAAQTSISTQIDAVVAAARQYGENLEAAAGQYEGQDHTAAGAIDGVHFG